MKNNKLKTYQGVICLAPHIFKKSRPLFEDILEMEIKCLINDLRKHILNDYDNNNKKLVWFVDKNNRRVGMININDDTMVYYAKSNEWEKEIKK